MPKILPRVQAMVLADQVYHDRATGKKVIAGTFNHIWSKEFPAKYRTTTYLYVNLTEIRGKCGLTMKWVDLADASVLLNSPTIEVDTQDPLANAEFAVEIPPFPLPHAGVFAFELYADANRIGSIRVKVDQAAAEKDDVGE